MCVCVRMCVWYTCGVGVPCVRVCVGGGVCDCVCGIDLCDMCAVCVRMCVCVCACVRVCQSGIIF